MGTLLTRAAEPPRIDFQRQIRPILSDACFQCHGPDSQHRMAGLRLDIREEAFSTRKNGTVIAPGKPEESLIYKRITHANPALRMPPASARKTVTSEQAALIKTWIAQGADWKEHWSFHAPVRPEVPAASANGWQKNAIDAFILARLESAGLQPAPEADRHTLIRRLSFDLTGLPPQPEEVKRFLADRKPGAYERLVDRLMTSPHYGEHRARFWLDAARYADTHGIHVDNYREMWPYRDWVVRAFNANKPFDQFTVEQVAGDLLPNRSIDQQSASGFHRCNATTNEGGSIPEEVEANYAKDRVETTGTVWLGLTIGCATCHDHKFDPLPQKDFYQFAAFFRNTVQPTMDGNRPDTPPVITLPASDDQARWSELKTLLFRLAAEKSARREKKQSQLEQWFADARSRLRDEPLEASHELFSLSLNAETPASRFQGTQQPLALPEDISQGEGPAANSRALRFAKDVALELPSLPIESGKPFSIAARVFLPTTEENVVVASQSVKVQRGNTAEDELKETYRGWSMGINSRTVSLVLSPGTDLALRLSSSSFERLQPGTWNHIVFTYDGSRHQSGLLLYVNGKPYPVEGGNLATDLKGEIRTDAPLRIGRRDKTYFAGGALSDFRVYDRVLRAEEARILNDWDTLRASLEKDPNALTAAEREQLTLLYANRFDSEYEEMQDRLAALEAEQRAIRRRAAVTHVMEERTDAKPMANILYRGLYDQPRAQVFANVPSVLPPMPESYPRNRLGLAKWLIDPANPLTARVTVNRFWQELFGTGIVKTAEDFGSQGETPVNPQLLDWLAVEFRESGWDVKKLIRLIVTSAAYRQSAATTSEKLKTDPDNRLLSRGPRFRLDGESVRDLALASSGLLVPRIGGPPVKPYQPDGIWETVAMIGSNTRHYQQDHGDDLHRRSLYTFWKRSAPPPSMEIFNAPTRETCTVRRERTNTPLQALVVMNDPQFVEASRHLAEDAIMAGKQFDKRVDLITMRVLARPFSKAERDAAARALQDLREHYAAKPEEAQKLLSIGEAKANPKIAAPELAAWTMVASSVLNLDEALNK
jgi:hypothetical protein